METRQGTQPTAPERAPEAAPAPVKKPAAAKKPAPARKTAPKQGLRERKKAEMRRKLLLTAIELFSERGFDKVSVAEIAQAADVSKMTVFNYFGSKEDLLMGLAEEHVDDAAEVVRDRPSGESAVAALRRQYLSAVADRDASVGLSDNPVVVRLRRLIEETPALLNRAHAMHVRAARALAEVLAEETGDRFGARVAAAQMLGVRNELTDGNYQRLLAGETPDEIAATAPELAARAFAQLENGLKGYAVRA